IYVAYALISCVNFCCIKLTPKEQKEEEKQTSDMVFSSNPLSLSVPDQAFDSWLRDSGYLELLDHRSSTTASAAPTTSSTSSSAANTHFFIFSSILTKIPTLLSLLTLNPFSKLTADDFSRDTPPWTSSFIGACGSYSVPSSASQARMRVHENVKRYARNYASLFILFFACTLYQIPLALFGLILSLALWDLFKFCSDKWGFDRYPTIRQVLIRISQCATAVILILLNVQMALFCALGVGYAVMILHAAFRKLTPAKQPFRKNENRR
ncbi:PRA1 domain-containing protein, partial [Cephalotus follicularis]